MADDDRAVSSQSSRQDVADFLNRARSVEPTAPRSGPAAGRIVFALDATASRQPNWDMAAHIQAEMFDAVSKIGTLDIQLVFFRGFGECKASKWCRNASELRDKMTNVQCRAGHTQIARVLQHVINQSRKKPDQSIDALIYVGDCVEEDADELGHLAGTLGMTGTRVFVFQDGCDHGAESVFRDMSRLGNGAFARLDGNAASVLADLLGAIASLVVGGMDALTHYEKNRKTGTIRLLTDQLKR